MLKYRLMVIFLMNLLRSKKRVKGLGDAVGAKVSPRASRDFSGMDKV